MLTARLQAGSPISATLGKPQSQEDTVWQEVAVLVGGTEHPKNQLMLDTAAANALTGGEAASIHDAVDGLMAQHFSTVPEAEGLSDFPEGQYRVTGAELAAVGDAIAQKSGTEAPAWPEGFTQAVEGIDLSVKEMWNRMTTAPLFTGAALPETVTLDFSGCANMRNMNGVMRGSTTAKEITIILPPVVPSSGYHHFAFDCKALEKITFIGDTFGVGKLLGLVGKCPRLHTVDAYLPVDKHLGATNDYNPIYGSPAIENIRYIPNSSPTTVTVVYHQWQSKLSDTSVISLANGLSANTGTLTLHADVKTRCGTILGRVSTVTEGETSYDFFTADGNGDTTLTEFITQVKGWTLA